MMKTTTDTEAGTRIACSDCGSGFDGDRHAARHAGWEPASSRTQHDIDRGPLVCVACITRLLSDALATTADYAAAQRAEHARVLAGCRRVSAIPTGRSRTGKPLRRRTFVITDSIRDIVPATPEAEVA